MSQYKTDSGVEQGLTRTRLIINISCSTACIHSCRITNQVNAVLSNIVKPVDCEIIGKNLFPSLTEDRTRQTWITCMMLLCVVFLQFADVNVTILIRQLWGCCDDCDDEDAIAQQPVLYLVSFRRHLVINYPGQPGLADTARRWIRKQADYIRVASAVGHTICHPSLHPLTGRDAVSSFNKSLHRRWRYTTFMFPVLLNTSPSFTFVSPVASIGSACVHWTISENLLQPAFWINDAKGVVRKNI